MIPVGEIHTDELESTKASEVFVSNERVRMQADACVHKWEGVISVNSAGERRLRGRGDVKGLCYP